MGKKQYTAEYKAQVVLEVLREERGLEEIAAANGINPNMLRGWKKQFLEKASSVFEQSRERREADRRIREAEDEKAAMLKTIGQLTMERDFLEKYTVLKPGAEKRFPR